MQGRGTDINIRRLLSHVDLAREGDTGIIAALNVEKAFESVECLFLWKVLGCYGFGYSSSTGIQLLESRLIACCRLPLAYTGKPGRYVLSPLGFFALILTRGWGAYKLG